MLDNRECILDLIDENTVCAEIGVWKGGFSRRILKKNPKHLYLIDPWQHQDYNGRWYSIGQMKMDTIYRKINKEYSNLDNVTIIKDFSENVVFEENYFDLVYIDGNHSYKYVLKDLNHYYKFMKNKSYLTGDDYGWKDKYCQRGPAGAVKDFCKEKGLDFQVIGKQFIIKIDK